MKRLFLDANATEPLRPAARNAVISTLDVLGNPSSVHATGRAARSLLETSRAAISAAMGGRAQDLVFTSGATEANALAIRGLGAGRRILAGATEHPAVLKSGPSLEIIPVCPDGQLDLAALERVLAEGRPALLCLMAANNETGVLHPLAEAARLCRSHGALLHIDAVQAVGRIEFDPVAIGADSVALSAHKIGGPKGVGALLLKPGADLTPLLAGGGQERGRRGGTEALPAIAGFAAAMAELDVSGAARLHHLRDAIEAGAGAVIAGGASPRLANTTCLILPGIRAETQVIALDLAGIDVSAGSACSSGKVSASPVLQAMGWGEDAGCAIRVSLPWNASGDAAERFLSAYHAMKIRLTH